MFKYEILNILKLMNFVMRKLNLAVIKKSSQFNAKIIETETVNRI